MRKLNARLYNSSVAPNARRVRIFLAEKGVSVPLVEVDLGKMEHKTPACSAVNPFHTIPALEFDDGTVICESLVICRYIEELHPDPNLFGAAAPERATIDMWQRLAEWRLLLPISQVFRHTHPHMALLENPQVAGWAAANRPRAVESMATFDKVMRDRQFLAGDRFTVADITGIVALDFTRQARINIPAEFAHLNRWRAAVGARRSVAA